VDLIIPAKVVRFIKQLNIRHVMCSVIVLISIF